MLFNIPGLLRAGVLTALTLAPAGFSSAAAFAQSAPMLKQSVKRVAPARLHTASAKRAEKKKKVDKMIVYIGTYTQGASKGIYIYDMDANTGMLTPAGNSPLVSNPSFLTIAPDHKHLYACNEVDDFDAAHDGAVSAFAIDAKTGGLSLLNQQPSAGSGPCFVSMDAKGKNVLVANYGSGSVGVLPVGADGKLMPPSAKIQHEGKGPDPARQEGPHAHSINLDPASHFAFAADLGLDKVFVYRFDASKGTLTPNTPPFASVAPGSGPRHFAFHPNGHYAYVINEMASTVTAFHYDAAKGELTQLQTISTLPEGYTGATTCAEIRVHPSGKFLYGSNRGHDSIAIFAIDPATGKLTAKGHQSTQGKTPRNFNLDPSGHFLIAANQDTDNVVVFRIDAQTGQLTPTGQTLDVPRPVCIKFLPLGK